MKQRNNNACERMRPWLSAYADGELNKRQTAAVRAHVCTCSSCAQELKELENVTALLHETVEDVAPSAQLHTSIMQAIRQMPRTAEKPSTAHLAWLRRVGGAMACVGCLLVIGVAVTMGGAGNKSMDAMMPGASAPMENAPEASDATNEPYYDADEPSYGLNDKADALPEEPEAPMDPVAPMEPEAPEAESPPLSPESSVYVLERISGTGEGLDGESTVWAGDDLKISVSASTRRIKVWFARESSREGSYELTDTELTVCFDDGECMSFDWNIEEDILWLTRK